MSEPIIRSLVAFLSGAVTIPLILFVILRAMFPVEATGYGNIGFWCAIFIGAALAATAAWFKPVPLWLAVVAGPIAVLALLVPWVAWRVANAA